MALPKIQAPIFQFKLPVLARNIKYRPFTVKEEKILLMAAESKDPADVYNAFQQVVNNCVLDEDIDASKLHLFDLEVLFLLLRIASVGEEALFHIKDELSETPVALEVNLMSVVKDSVSKATVPSKQIQITDEIGIVMKDITLDLFVDAATSDEELSSEQAFNLIKKLIDKVFDKEETYELADSSDEEINEFLDSFQAADMEKLYQYLYEIPRVSTVLKYKVGTEDRVLKLEGVADFFQYV